MDRKGFLMRFGGMLGAGLLAPQLLRGIDISKGTKPTVKKPYKPIAESTDALPKDDKELTEKFFAYLKKNNVGFKWERVYSPFFELKNVNGGMKVDTRKFRTNFNPMWKEGYACHISESLSAHTLTTVQYDTLDEYYEYLFTQMSKELRMWKGERHYIYQLMYTPTMYNPMNFDAMKGMIIRSKTV